MLLRGRGRDAAVGVHGRRFEERALSRAIALLKFTEINGAQFLDWTVANNWHDLLTDDAAIPFSRFRRYVYRRPVAIPAFEKTANGFCGCVDVGTTQRIGGWSR
jgi:hypothetical protein